MRELLRSAYGWVAIDDDARVVWFVRSGEPLESPEQGVAMFRGVIKAIATIDRSRYAIVSDLRAAPGRNDPSFETVIEPLRAELYEGFARRAVLVRSAAGKLQVQRLSKQSRDSAHPEVFTSEADAIAYATQARPR
jgi:hypothetical protein